MQPSQEWALQKGGQAHAHPRPLCAWHGCEPDPRIMNPDGHQTLYLNLVLCRLWCALEGSCQNYILALWCIHAPLLWPNVTFPLPYEIPVFTTTYSKGMSIDFEGSSLCSVLCSLILVLFIPFLTPCSLFSHIPSKILMSLRDQYNGYFPPCAQHL